jgi:hypothetical protein
MRVSSDVTAEPRSDGNAGKQAKTYQEEPAQVHNVRSLAYLRLDVGLALSHVLIYASVLQEPQRDIAPSTPASAQGTAYTTPRASSVAGTVKRLQFVTTADVPPWHQRGIDGAFSHYLNSMRKGHTHMLYCKCPSSPSMLLAY